jgi:hypothetical protein
LWRKTKSLQSEPNHRSVRQPLYSFYFFFLWHPMTIHFDPWDGVESMALKGPMTDAD